MKSPEIRLGTYRFDPEAGRLADASGAPVELRNQAMEVLAALAAHPGEPVDRAEIVEKVWQNRAGAEDGLVQCIAEIRRALNDTGKTIVETIPRKGYRLVATPAEPRFGRRARHVALGLAALVALGLVAALTLWTGPTPPLSRPVIAVLPFETRGAAAEDTGIDDAIGDGIIASLAGYHEFDVIARQSSFRFRAGDRDLTEIGRELGADYLVQGRLELEDRALGLAVQLIDVADATLKMVDAFEVPLEDMFDANDEIAYRIANTVSGSVMSLNARAHRAPGAVDALLLDNRGRLLFQSGPSREKWQASLAMSQQAIDAYPEAEWGHVGKAMMLRTGVRFGYDDGDSAEVLAEAEAAARKGIEINPTNYLSHFALGRVRMQQGDISGSIAALDRAADLNPSSAMVLNALAQSYLYADETDALAQTVDRVRLIAPLPDTLTLWVRAWAEWQMGACDAAQATVAEMADVPPDARKLKAVIAMCIGDTETAAGDIDAYLELRPDWTLRREVEVNAANWVTDGPRDRWLAALSAAGIPD